MAKIWTMGEMLVEIMRPKAGIQLYEAGEFLGPYPSGAPAIFIDTAARLGHKAGIIGGVGDDDFGRCLVDRLSGDGVDCSYVLRVKGSSTAVAFVTYFEDGSRKFIFHIDGTPAVAPKSPAVEQETDASFFHIMGCSLLANENFRHEIIATMEKFAKAGTRISFDPNIRPELLGERRIEDIVAPIMEQCSVLLPGMEELLLISGCNSIPEAVEKLFKFKKLELIALKKGKKGCTVYTRTDTLDFGIYDIKPVDPTGAGDSFDAAFLCGFSEKLPLSDCIKQATAAASLNTAAFGPMEGKINPQTVRELILKGSIA